MTDLGLVPTQDILRELKGRFDYMIFSGVKEMGPATQAQEHEVGWKGHVTFCAGMATDLIRDMQDWARDEDAERGE